MLDENHSRKHVHPAQSIILLTGLLTLVSIGLFHSFPPAPSTLSAPLSEFSSARAISHVKQIAAKSHPAGSLEHAQVRQYLVDQVQALGFKPDIQSTLVVNPQTRYAGKIHNVLVRIPGTKPGKALLLSAHYDSVSTGPGAADDGASVAAILETLRALKSHSPLQNDLICLFTDSEETGLLGSKAFVQQHPWTKEVGLALNFEYRGNRGAFMMFETSPGNDKLIEGLATATPYISATSLFYEVYKRLPSGSDLSVFKQAGILGMNFAAIEGFTHYHTQLDRPELLDQASLQQEGDIMFALVKHFGNRPLAELKSVDRVYFDMPGLGLVNYSANWILPLNCLVSLLFAITAMIGLRRKILSISRMLAGTFAFLFILIVATASSYFLWSGIRQLHPEYASFLQGDTYNSHWYLRAFVFLTIALVSEMQAWICRWLSPIEFTFGVQLCWLVLLWMTYVWMPGASFLFFWPLLAMLVALGIICIKVEGISTSRMLIFLGSAPVFLASAPGILLFSPFIRNLFIALTQQMVSVVVVFLVLLLGLLTPLLEIIAPRKWLLISSLSLGFTALLAGSLTSDFDADHPRQNSLFYALNSPDQQAFWLSTDEQLDEWTLAYFPNAGAKQQDSGLFGDNYGSMWKASAPLLALQPPAIETLEDSVIANKNAIYRTIKIQVKSPRLAPKMKVTIEGIDVIQAKVAGQLYTQPPQSHWSLNSVGLTNENLVIEFTVKPGVPFKVRVIDFTYGLPAIAQNRRPPYMISKPSEFSDTTDVVNVINY